MLILIKTMLVSILALFRTRRDLVLENLALRHPLAVLQRTTKLDHCDSKNAMLCRMATGTALI